MFSFVGCEVGVLVGLEVGKKEGDEVGDAVVKIANEDMAACNLLPL